MSVWVQEAVLTGITKMVMPGPFLRNHHRHAPMARCSCRSPCLSVYSWAQFQNLIPAVGKSVPSGI